MPIGGGLVSVIIPVHNAESTIERCVKAVTSQKYQDLEIILVDNNSTDRSISLCRGLAECDARIVVVEEATPGPSAARNAGLVHAHGEFIGFCDADDYFDDDMINIMIRQMDDSDAQIVVCGYRYVGAGYIWGRCKKNPSNRIDSSSEEFARRALLDQNVMGSVCNKLYKRQIIGDVMFDEAVYFCEDTLFNILVSRNVSRVAYVGIPLYNYVIEGSSITRSEFDTAKERFSSFVRVFNCFSGTGLDESVAASQFSLSVRDGVCPDVSKDEYCRWAEAFFRSKHVPLPEKMKVFIRMITGSKLRKQFWAR